LAQQLGQGLRLGWGVLTGGKRQTDRPNLSRFGGTGDCTKSGLPSFFAIGPITHDGSHPHSRQGGDVIDANLARNGYRVTELS
jgi:hypothetical protein